ncbi:hypothetical protein EDB87DRAFT_1762222 [Lactarius vividus]|nr:hypothetical protein EDB87DRAFT_1762222 [Lactarius vividus]
MSITGSFVATPQLGGCAALSLITTPASAADPLRPKTGPHLAPSANLTDEIIVYVAHHRPHPGNGKLASTHTQSSPDAKAFPSPADPASVAPPIRQTAYNTPHAPALPPEPEPESKLWSEPVPKDVNVPAQSLALAPASAPAPALAFKNFSFSLLSSFPKPTYRTRWPRRIARRKAERNMMFGSFGAMRAEATLRELDPRRADQRRGDSNVGWGRSTSGLAEVEDSEDDGGMLVDDIKADAISAFVWSMAAAGKVHIGAGDLEDEERIRLEDADEDEEEDECDSDSDGEDVDTELELADGMRILTAESGDDDEASRSSFADDDDSDDTSEDQEVTPKRSFQARLQRIRSRTVGRPVKDMMQEELDQEQELDDDDDDSDSDIDDEESIIAQIQGLLDERDEILRGKDRNSPKRKRDKHVPVELHDQWECDRKKKTERKRLRELERTAAALDPFAFMKKKRRGKKERKIAARKAAAASISLETVVRHMRRFVEDLGSAPTLSLPPMERHARKSVHDLAAAFNLNSKSEGNGAARFTRLIKTTRSGLRIDERKVAHILGKPAPPHGGDKGKGNGKAGGKIRPRDGELVGGAAPKIDGSNLGFKMLSAMRWEEGNRIGTVGGVGLDIPLVAVIKTTKLGLGASAHKS